MAPSVIDLTGQRFGCLTVEKRAGRDVSPRGRYVTWSCRCDCGQAVIVRGAKLREGTTRSCGCYGRERNIEAHTRHGHAASGSRSREYQAWSQAKSRCERVGDRGYKNYGGRGIRMCPEWSDSFEAFLRDVGPCPPGLTLERKDVNGHYESGNCRWATNFEQHQNRRDNLYVDLDSERVTVAEASRRLGISRYFVERNFVVSSASA